MSSKTETQKPITQTVKVPHDVYVRMKSFGAENRRSNQDILLTALEEYLKRQKS